MTIGSIFKALTMLITTVYREQSAMAAQVETYLWMSGGIES
jgi:hypothetical protein